MTKEEKIKKIEEYTNRHEFWRDKVLTQLGFSINLFLTIGFGLIAFLVSQKDKYPTVEMHTDWKFNWNLALYIATMILTSVSILLGAISVTSRLFDLRITSHITLVRKRSVEKINQLLPDNFSTSKKKNILANYISTVFKKIERILDEDYNDFESLTAKFKNLRNQTDQLGNLVWISHKLQILIILIAVLLYGTSLLV